uniref:Raf homolog serine/threonine-protein kinase n=1 Tax=Panagrolaimus superbus TaxID=310955 RepID=A0A914Z2Y5_9BILA
MIIEVHLPFNTHSKLPIRKGVTAREAIGKLLEKRNIDPKMCRVCLSADPKSPRIDLKIDLELLASKLEKNELWVHSEGLQIMSSINHVYKKVNFNLTNFLRCNVCNNIIFMKGYRCERCNFYFHAKCWGKSPTYCDLTEQIPHNAEMANQLRNFCENFNDEGGSPFANLATEILDSLRTGPENSNDEGQIGGEITRQSALRRHDSQKTPYSRDRASSAPNINVIKDEYASSSNLQTTSMHSGFQPFLTTTTHTNDGSYQGHTNRTEKPSLSSSSLYPPSSNRLIPSALPINGSISTSPTSTCSSPTPYNVADTLPGPSSTNLTPPQSAPPQRIPDEFFPRTRSRSPGEMAGFHSPGGHNARGFKRQSAGDWELGQSEINIGPKIGSGSFGTVFKGYYYGDVAIKVLNVPDPTPTLLKAFRNEMALLRNTRHTNVLNFMGWTRSPQLAIVTQWCQGSSLYHHIHVVEPRIDFTLAMIIKICRQIVHGMSYLHAKNIVHRDLKTNNIFLTEDNTVKIGDFGLATVKTRWSSTSAGQQAALQPTGSILWMAPEVIRMHEHTTRSDVYSFGICLYELLTARLPYDHINNRDQIIFMVGMGLLRPDNSHLRVDTPSKLRTLFVKCIEYNANGRPEFSKIKPELDKVAANSSNLTKSQSDSYVYKVGKNHHPGPSTVSLYLKDGAETCKNLFEVEVGIRDI